jgi:pimeloyl-ACP methyl ester carboxylesterase
MGEWANGRMARAPGGWRTLDFEDEDEDDFDDERPLDIGYWYWSFARSAQRMVAGQGASGSGRDWVFGERSKREGVPVLFLHGFSDDARTWDRVVAELAGAGLRLVRPFQRGFGPSRVTAIAAHSGQVAALAQDESSRSGAVLVDGSGRSGPSGEMADGLSS